MMPQGFQEELQLERLAVIEYEADADRLWKAGEYAMSIIARRYAQDARRNARLLEKELKEWERVV
jgi:hypothetical protein